MTKLSYSPHKAVIERGTYCASTNHHTGDLVLPRLEILRWLDFADYLLD